MITNCTEIKKPIMVDISKSQLWNCLNGNKILDSCKYQITATDMVAASLDYKERIEMLVDYIEASVELYPTCRAVVFETSKNSEKTKISLSNNWQISCMFQGRQFAVGKTVFEL